MGGGVLLLLRREARWLRLHWLLLLLLIRLGGKSSGLRLHWLLLVLLLAREAGCLRLHWLLSREACRLGLQRHAGSLRLHGHARVLRLHLVHLAITRRLGTKAARLQVGWLLLLLLLLAILLLAGPAAVPAAKVRVGAREHDGRLSAITMQSCLTSLTWYLEDGDARDGRESSSADCGASGVLEPRQYNVALRHSPSSNKVP